MNAWWPIAFLALSVAAILLASRQPICQQLFQWLPVPLWCYALPIGAVALGWLPSGSPIYRSVTECALPIALGLLLLGVNLPAVIRAGSRALIAMVVGAAGIVAGTVCGVWVLRSYLPSDAWKGAGALAATWTGGTMNLLALRSLLDTPDRLFAPLVIVDALVAYSWMAVLVAASGFRNPINRWLGATEPSAVSRSDAHGPERGDGPRAGSLAACFVTALALWVGARALAPHLPTCLIVTSANGWTVLLVTTAALGLSLLAPIRRMAGRGGVLGYPGLYLVLAATGAQASLQALWSAPVWIGIGCVTALAHGAILLLTGRLCRIPLGTLATASQANIGGVVSAPLVGAVYHQSLAPVGLLLAMAGNALGTYVGVGAATLCRWLIRAAAY